MKKINILIAVVSIFIVGLAQAQEVHHGESFELDETLNASQSFEYLANSHISLNTGFKSEPNNSNNTFLHLDSWGVFPPEEGITGGSDDGVVGTLGGDIDIGALGAACYTIPLTVPKGIGGIQPNLCISYNSQRGNGLLGWGWDIGGISSINRVNSTQYHDGIVKPVNFDNDRFAIDGQRLIQVQSTSNEPNCYEYRTEVDGLNKIVSYTRTVNGGGLFGYGQYETVSYFIVWTADGKRIEYGHSNDSKVYLQEENDVCQWLVNKVEDRDGNFMEFHYEQNTYGYKLTSITYTGNNSASPIVNPFCEVVFNYENRSDVEMTTIGFDVMKQTNLLESIVVKKRNVTEQTFTELYRYDFDYYDLDRTNGIFYSRLETIMFSCGEQFYNPTRIFWNNQFHQLQNRAINTPNHTDAFHNAVKFSGDFNGDGFTDVIVTRPSNGVYSQAELYLNKGGGTTLSFEYVRTFNLGDNADWIYIGDFNGDGKDDLLFANKEIRVWPLRHKLTIKVCLSNLTTNGSLVFTELPTLGPYKIKRTFQETVLVGDYFGKGYDGIIIQSSLEDEDHEGQFQFDQAHYIECASNGLSLVENTFNQYMSSNRFFLADYDGDGAVEILYLTSEDCRVNKLKTSNNGYSYDIMSINNSINHNYDCYIGDFNGDGKSDLLSCHLNEEEEAVWQVNLFNGRSFMAPYIISNFEYEFLGDNYLFTLQNPHQSLYFVKVADFNGDGYADIRCRKTSNSYDYQFYFGPIVENNSYTPFAGRKSLHCYQTPPDNMSTCLGFFIGKESYDELGWDYVFSLKPSSDRFTVNKIVNGMGITTELDYDYLMPNPSNPSPQDFYSLDRESADFNNHILTKGLPFKALKKVSKKNVRNRLVSVNYQYKGIMYHQWGNGILGFISTKETHDIVVQENNANHTEIISKTERQNNLTDYAPFIALAPSFTKTYDKNGFLLSETYFENAAYENAHSTNMKVFFPVVTKQVTNEYDVDNNSFLRKSITDLSYYKDATGNQYNNIVRRTSTFNGVTDNNNITSVSNCEFQTTEEVDYHTDELDNWLINRPYHVGTRNVHEGNSGIGNCVKYQYYGTEGCHHQLKFVTNVPNNGLNGPDYSDPLTTKTEYTYDCFGRIVTETLTAPNENLPSKNTLYEYGQEYDYRLLTRTENALGYETSYTYDNDYDYCTSITDQNGLTTRYYQDPLGITKRTTFSDGTESCQALRWKNGSFLEEDYYVWTKKTGEAAIKEYKKKTGEVYKVVGIGFNGQDIITDYTYDQYGRLSSKSFPHYEDNSAPETETYGYDEYHRPVSIVYPDGTRKEIIYDGLERTEKFVSADNTEQSVTTEINIIGQTIQVTDADQNLVDYGYYPDGNLHWAKVNGSNQVKNVMQYDHRGNRISHEDPNYGVTTSQYNAYGELFSQEDPKENQTVMTYDILGRMTSKETRDANNQVIETTEWNYCEENGKKGLLSSISYNNGQHVVNYTYDELLRVDEVNEHVVGENNNYVTKYGYDEASRIKSTIYPTGVVLTNHFNSNGYLTRISENDNGTVWKTEEIDEFGFLKRFTLGNGISTEYTYDAQTKQLNGIQTRKNGSFIQNLSYEYDDFHNLAVRTDHRRELEESFTYDILNRLTGISLNGNPTGVMTYDAMGRMTGKSQDGRLVFATTQNSFDMTDKPHALRTAETSENVFPANDQFINYTNFNKVQNIVEGNNSLSYIYGHDRQRLKMTETINGIQRKKVYVGQCEFITENNIEKARTFLRGPIGVFAVIEKENGTNAIHYVHKDHLGSWTTITDDNGSVEQELSFDAWGNMRNPETWSGGSSLKPMFDCGFTGHEHLSAFGLINMNGRMYDPIMSSFLSVDALVNDPTCAQGFNRYAYCMYNPLKYVDPSGWQPLGGMGPNPFHDDWSVSHVIPAHEPRDFCNAYYLCNLAFYGSFDPWCDGGGGGGGGGIGSCGYTESYGYYVTHYAYSVYNYTSSYAQMQLIQNWQNNPSYRTNLEMREAGISNVTVGTIYGQVNGQDGYRNSYYHWEDSAGKSHSASACFEYVGGHDSGIYILSNQPLEMYFLSNPDIQNKANILAQSLGVPMGTIENGMECGAKAYHNVSMLSGRLTEAQYMSALTKSGVGLLKVTKGLGVAGAVVSTFINGCQTYDYYHNQRGEDWRVGAKTAADLVMTGVSFCGPIGFCIGVGYFIIDVATDGFGISYEVKP